jgi:hypothetical protein
MRNLNKTIIFLDIFCLSAHINLINKVDLSLTVKFIHLYNLLNIYYIQRQKVPNDEYFHSLASNTYCTEFLILRAITKKIKI